MSFTDFDSWLRRRNVADLTPGELDEINPLPSMTAAETLDPREAVTR